MYKKLPIFPFQIHFVRNVPDIDRRNAANHVRLFLETTFVSDF